MLRPLVLLLLEVNLVTAFRDSQALAHQKSTICFGSCCRPKCSGQSYSLKAESKGEWKFHDCKVRRNGGAKWFHGYGRTCIEDCTVLHSKEPQEAIVMRRSGRGSSPQCELYYQDLTLQEFAMDFVEQLETALTLTNGNYGDLPLMKAGKVLSFLEKVEKKVLKPEFDQQRYSQEIKSNTVAIIGDLHGQLFNLIGFLLVIKDKYKDKGFSMLEGSSLLFCDPGMQYVFLGDYVDRGERGVEVLLLLLAYKARCPRGMVVLQGNHETPDMWYGYGFAQEVNWKFDAHLHAHNFKEVVELLPYVAVLPGKWMAMHGGLSPELKIACSGKGGRFSECLTKTVGQSSVWPDLHDGKGFIPSTRGAPFFYDFGMDVARDFLESNNLRGIIRGHEQVQEGAKLKQMQRPAGGTYFVVTVFSAADYVGLFCRNGRPPVWDQQTFADPGEGNDGAVMLLDYANASAKTFFTRMSPLETRRLAREFTKAECRDGTSVLESQFKSQPKVTLESFIEQNHKSIKRLEGGNDGDFDSCSLDKDETEAWKEKTRQILANAENREFEARKLIDLQGEALIHGENLEVCKAMKKDKVMLEVYHELGGTDETILEKDIETREHDLEVNFAE